MNIPQTTHTKIFKHKLLFGMLLLFCANLFIAQNKLLKLDREFTFSKVPLFKLNASHTKIIITTWDKENIGISAYSLGNADQEYLRENNQLWEIEIQSTDSILILNTNASKQLPAKVISSYSTAVSSSDATSILLKKMLDPVLSNFQNISIPLTLQQRLNEIQFDFEAYNKLGETYFKIWEYNLLKGLDKESTKEIHTWSKQMTSQLVNVSNNNNNNNTLQKVINSPNNKMPYRFYESHTVIPNITIEKIVELKLPKKVRSYFNTRFGSVQIKNEIKDLQAKLKYTSLAATNILGNKTIISVSSAPVSIEKWTDGNLQLQYVKSAEIKSAQNVQLATKSSKVLIYSLNGNGKFKSSFSQLGIENINPSFSNLSFLSTNSDLVLSLPHQTAYNFVYSGEMSGIKIPQNKLALKSLGDFRNLMLHGYSQSRNTEKEIQMNMINSQIILK